MAGEFESQHVEIPEEILRSGLSRRGMLAAMGLMGGTAAVVGSGGLMPGSADASSAYVLPRGFKGNMSDLRHVVIVMQENRSFDQYFGAMPGVRGFKDKQALRFPDGTDVFSQPNGSGARVRPTHVTTVADSEHGLDHSYETGTGAWNHGRYNNWVPAKSAATMNHLTGAEIPWQWALASNYTICDNYHCSVMGPTTPNRLYHWTGTSGGVTANGGETSGTRSWQTYPEALQAAGVSWRVFVDNYGIGDSGIDGYRGDYTDNPIRGFSTFTTSGFSLTDFANRSDAAKNAAGTGLIWRAHSTPYALSSLPDNDSDTNLNGVLADFIASCRPGAAHPLPQVSWVVSPYRWSEHPSADPEHGAHYVNRVLTALQSNPAIWNHTLVIVNFDENDGYFDHVLPPYPEASTPKEYSGSTPIGLGARVPCTLISPWTRGGWVNSEVFDHTSVIRFLETWTAYMGKPARSTTITPWRRAICGDLTSAIDFAHPILGKPSLPNTAALIAIANAGGAIAPKVAAKDKWNYPALKPRPLSFQVNGTFTEDRHTGVVKAHLSLKGGPRGKAVSLQAFPDAHLPFVNTPYTVGARAPRTHRWDTGKTRGKYAFSIYGPDGFVRSHAGKVVPAGKTGVAVPRVGIGLDVAAQKVRFTLSNDGDRATTYTLAAHDYVGGTKTVRVGAGKSVVVTWPTRHGYYDVVITRTGDRFWRHRYAGRVAHR